MRYYILYICIDARQDEFLTRHGGSKVPTLSKATLTVFAQVLQRHIQG